MNVYVQVDEVSKIDGKSVERSDQLVLMCLGENTMTAFLASVGVMNRLW